MVLRNKVLTTVLMAGFIGGATVAFTCGDKAEQTAGASASSSKAVVQTVANEGDASCGSKALQTASTEKAGCPMASLQQVAFEGFGEKACGMKAVAATSSCDKSKAPVEASNQGGEQIWAFVDASGSVAQPCAKTISAVNALLNRMGESPLSLQMVSVSQEQGGTFVQVKNSDKQTACSTVGGGLVAAVNEEGELTVPTHEQMQEASSRALVRRETSAEASYIDPSNPEKGMKARGIPMMLKVSQGADGSLAADCAAACAAKKDLHASAEKDAVVE